MTNSNESLATALFTSATGALSYIVIGNILARFKGLPIKTKVDVAHVFDELSKDSAFQRSHAILFPSFTRAESIQKYSKFLAEGTCGGQTRLLLEISSKNPETSTRELFKKLLDDKNWKKSHQYQIYGDLKYQIYRLLRSSSVLLPFSDDLSREIQKKSEPDIDKNNFIKFSSQTQTIYCMNQADSRIEFNNFFHDPWSKYENEVKIQEAIGSVAFFPVDRSSPGHCMFIQFEPIYRLYDPGITLFFEFLSRDELFTFLYDHLKIWKNTSFPSNDLEIHIVTYLGKSVKY